MRKVARLGIALFFGGLVATGTVRAQFLESDEVPRERTVPLKETIDGLMTSSKLHLGPIRLIPAASITNAGYDSNVFSSNPPVADWTATFVLGSTFLLPMGSKMYFRADVFPHYTWYDKLSDRNRWGGVYDGAILGFFNRASFEAKGSNRQDYVLYSSEFPSYVFENLVSGTGNVEVDLTQHFSLFAGGGWEQVRFTQYSGPPIQDLQVKLNNSNDTEVRGGVRYHITENWSVAALVEQVWSDFQYVPETRDNKSLAYLGAIYFSRPRLFVNVIAGYREGTATNGSTFPDYQIPVGSYYVSFYPLRWIELQTYGHRKVEYSISLTQPYYFDNKVGFASNIELFDHVLVKGFVEDGPNTYPVPEQIGGGEFVDRVDHVKDYGGGLSIKLPARIVLTGLVIKQVYTSNVPGSSRNYLRFTAFFNFTGTYTR
jgi:hypothetical protein